MDWLVQSSQKTLNQPWANLSFWKSDSDLDPWFPPQSRTLVLGTLVPASIVLFTLLYDVLSTIRWPKFVQNAWRALKSPFMDFMQLEDLDGEYGPDVVSAKGKVWLLVVLSTLEAVAWATALAYELLAGDVERSHTLQTGAVFLAWVSIVIESNVFT